MKRSMSVAGSFYPARPVELERYFEHFNTVYDEEFTLPSLKSRAVIVPHAGYVYSGYTANIAYRILRQSGVKKFVVIGPSHRVGFEGISLCDFTSYETPFGDISSQNEIAQKIRDRFSLPCYPEAHHEHSTEVQFPFIKHYLPDAEIVELVYSSVDSHYVSKIIDFVLSIDDCGVIISTDLSHFYDEKQANILDNICLKAVKNLDLDLVHEGCEACGITGVKGMMLSAKELSLTSHLLDYRTSADASGDTSRVVGYMSACFS
ncbi:AmmeMemoRadiSam system protein B [Sulfurimonas sp.]|uniref:AmmeMemoRadiSam system protein B n=1 Tax=Sulfurimonas sp. TaxID=2022749 RepID=UPI0035647AD3